MNILRNINIFDHTSIITIIIYLNEYPISPIICTICTIIIVWDTLRL